MQPQEWLMGDLTVFLNYLRRVDRRWKNSFTGTKWKDKRQRAKAARWEIPFRHKERSIFTRKWNRAPERLWNIQVWRPSKFNWTQPWATWSKVDLFWARDWIRDLFPDWIIPGFYSLNVQLSLLSGNTTLDIAQWGLPTIVSSHIFLKRLKCPTCEI